MDKTLLRIRCTCGFPVGLYQEYFTNSLKAGLITPQIMEKIGIRRNCCMIYFNCPPLSPKDYPERVVERRAEKSIYPPLDTNIGIFFVSEQTASRQETTIFLDM